MKRHTQESVGEGESRREYSKRRDMFLNDVLTDWIGFRQDERRWGREGVKSSTTRVLLSNAKTEENRWDEYHQHQKHQSPLTFGQPYIQLNIPHMGSCAPQTSDEDPSWNLIWIYCFFPSPPDKPDVHLNDNASHNIQHSPVSWCLPSYPEVRRKSSPLSLKWVSPHL